MGEEQQNLFSASFDYETLKLSRNPDKAYFSSVLKQNQANSFICGKIWEPVSNTQDAC